ncbi:MAG: hypothetical protein PVS3B3_08370 [Ktedonobacteraceae bacterium]
MLFFSADSITFHYGKVLAHAIAGATLKQVTSKAIDAQQHARDIHHAIEHFLLGLMERWA